MQQAERRGNRARRRYYNPLQKDYATLLQSSEESGGERTLFRIEVAPGGGNIPHYHRTYDEHFRVLDGELEVTVGGEARLLRAGEEAVAPMNTLHDFRNPTGDTTTFLVEMRPGVPGFEKAIAVGYGLAADGLTHANSIPKNLYHLALVVEWSEIRVPGVMMLLNPLLRLLARRARRKGIDRELERRYVV